MKVVIAVMIVILPIVYIFVYMKGLEPKFIKEEKYDKNMNLKFDDRNLCRSNKMQALFALPYEDNYNYFALKGHKAVKFKLDQFNSVYGSLIKERADPETIYIYKYRKKYRNIVNEP